MKVKHILWIVATMFLIALFANFAYSSENDYVNKYCKGEIEVILKDSTRVDCLTFKSAIEYDYGYKWYEAIGQSLHYAMFTGRRAGVVLIIAPSEIRFYHRAKALVEHYNLPIDVETVSK